MKHCVIHRGFVELTQRSVNTISSQKDLDRMNKAILAQLTIEELLANEKDAVVLDNDCPEKVADFFESGDEVTLYGCGLGGCLRVAEDALKKKGVKVTYHPSGCI